MRVRTARARMAFTVAGRWRPFSPPLESSARSSAARLLAGPKVTATATLLEHLEAEEKRLAPLAKGDPVAGDELLTVLYQLDGLRQEASERLRNLERDIGLATVERRLWSRWGPPIDVVVPIDQDYCNRLFPKPATPKGEPKTVHPTSSRGCGGCATDDRAPAGPALLLLGLALCLRRR